MEFDVNIRVKVDANLFLLNPEQEDREDHIVDMVLNALYECDDLKVTTIQSEEIYE